MSKTVITAEMVGDPDSPLVGALILDGDDRPTVGTVYQSVDDALVARSLRLPKGLYEQAIALDHSAGFLGVVRDALEAHLNQVKD